MNMQRLITNHLIHRQSGLSMVELMVATTLGLIMMTAVASLFLSSKQSYLETERNALMEESGRYAIRVLTESLQQVDFWGHINAANIAVHGNLDAITSDCSGNAAGYSYQSALWAVKATDSSMMDCLTDATPDTDILVVKNTLPATTALASLASDRSYVLANDYKGVLFDGADTAPTVTTGGAVPGGEAWEYQAAIYYVRSISGAQPALYRKILTGNTWGGAEEVAYGVEHIHYVFGVDADADGTADEFVSAADADWPNVVTVRVYLLVRSDEPDAFYTDTRTYNLGDITIDPDPDDNYHRTVFTTSINLRNRHLQIAGGF
jgi:type IV pilus assembly protein PilW